MILLAHLTNINEVRIEQSLQAHCMKTAEYASKRLQSVGLYYTGYLAGMTHDMGKGTRIYNHYLEDAFSGKDVIKGSVNHTFAGVIWLLEKYHQKSFDLWTKLACEVIGYAIGAHHGLFDCVDLDGQNGFMRRLEKDKSEIYYEEAVHNFFAQVIAEEELESYFQKAVEEIREFFERSKKEYGDFKKTFFQIGMLIRLVLSAVIYGDRKDTSEFMCQRAEHEEQSISWTESKKYFELKMQKFDSSTALNKVRSEISEQCLKFADRPGGIYRLNVPTGAGKTLCTLRYALAHAQKYQKERIIFIIPLLSVLEQNAQVIREYLPDNITILEHHSNYVHKSENKEELDKEELDNYELLTSNWNAPVVVSTLVQLLDILFTDKTSAIRRMQALSNSVIIIDEIQSLPKKVTFMFNMAMNFLQQFCNTTIILSSATQPCFEDVDWPIRLTDKPDMVLLNKDQMKIFRRSDIVNCVDPYGMDLDECACFCGKLMDNHESLLVICNTKTEARNLYKKMQEQADIEGWDIFHLSTGMCQEHRMRILKEVQEKLAKLQDDMRQKQKVKKLICISTQLVEAGVDFSFNGVVRVLAGIDNIAQAAGRCNRSNEYVKGGKVYLINLKDENLSMLQEILYAQNSTRKVLANKALLENESVIGELATHEFYKYLFNETEKTLRYPIKDYNQLIYLTDLWANCNGAVDEDTEYVLHQPFDTIGKVFQVFDEDIIDVLVPYGKGKQLIEELKKIKNTSFELVKMKDCLKQARMYTIGLYRWQKNKLIETGFLDSLFDGRIMALDERMYDDQYGLTNFEEQAVEAFIM